MESKTTERPKCGNEIPKERNFAPSKWLKLKRFLLQILKYVLRYILLKPVVWRWVMVHAPEFIEKVENFFKDGISFLIELFD